MDPEGWILTDTELPENGQRVEFIPPGVAHTDRPLRGTYHDGTADSALGTSQKGSWYFQDDEPTSPANHRRSYREGVIRWRPLR